MISPLIISSYLCDNHLKGIPESCCVRDNGIEKTACVMIKFTLMCGKCALDWRPGETGGFSIGIRKKIVVDDGHFVFPLWGDILG